MAMVEHSHLFKKLYILMKFLWKGTHDACLMILIAPPGMQGLMTGDPWMIPIEPQAWLIDETGGCQLETKINFKNIQTTH